MYLLVGFYFILINFIMMLYLKYNFNVAKKVYLIILFFVIIFVSYSIEDLSRDFRLYREWFDVIKNENFFDLIVGKDPAFKLIISLIQILFGNNYFIIYLIYMSMVSFFQYKFCEKIFYGYNFFILLWLIFCGTFVLHDITQIRVGLAIAISSFAIINNIQNSKNLFNFSILFLGFFLHQSIFVLIFSYFVFKIFFRLCLNRICIIVLLTVGFLSNLFLQGFLNKYLNLYLFDNQRAINYLNGVEDISAVSLFSFFFIIKISVIVFLLFFWEQLSRINKSIVFLSSVGCFFYMFFMFNNVFALRVSELFILFSLSCFIIPFDIKILDKKFKNFWFLFLIILGFILFYSSTKILLD